VQGGKARGLPDKGWVVAEIFITPLGTGSPTIRDSIRELVRLVKQSGLTHELTAMGTLVEGPIEEVFALTRRLHDACFDAGSGTSRVITSLRVDERRGDALTLAGKVQGAQEEA
jgi:uncharacterized protein (TIGR00106 family)